MTTDVSDDTRTEASPDEVAAADEEGLHWFEKVKDVLILLKVGLISYLMINAIYYRHKKHGHYDSVTVMLVINILVLIGLLVFEYTTKYIAGFFGLVLLANYCNFLGFMIMLRHLKTPEQAMLVKHTNWYLIAMNCLYGLTVGLSFMDRFGPFCVASKLYPPCMNFANGLFILNYFYHLYMHYKDYWLKWNDYEEVRPAVGKGITKEGLAVEMKGLGIELNADALNEMFLKADADGSGTIDFEEFKTFMSETKTMFLMQMDTYIFF